MGRKKIQKAPKGSKVQDESPHASDQQADAVQEPVVEPKDEAEPPTPKTAGKKKGGKAKETNQKESKQNAKEVELFTQQFNQRIDDFKTFYREYLQLRANTGDVDPVAEFNKVTNDVKRKIETACLKVIKEDLTEAEKWISSEQHTIKNNISNVEKAVHDTKKTLESTGTFSSAEIDTQVEGIRKKKAVLEKSYNDLEAIKGRAVELYKHENNAIDQQ